MNIRTPVPGVSVQAGGGAGVGGILAVGAGTFLILLAYTGKLQDVWSAAFGHPLQTINNAITGGTHGETTAPGGNTALDPTDPLAGGTTECSKIPSDFNASSVGFAPCPNGSCPPNSFLICNGSQRLCATHDSLAGGRPMGWHVCTGSESGAGESFTHVTAWPMGGWHTAASPSARPAASWGFGA